MWFLKKIIAKAKRKRKQKKLFCLIAVLQHKSKIFKLTAQNGKLYLKLAGSKSKRAKEDSAQLSFEKAKKIAQTRKWKEVKISKFGRRFVAIGRMASQEKRGLLAWTSEDLLNWKELNLPPNLKKPFVLVGGYNFQRQRVAYVERGQKISYYLVDKNWEFSTPRDSDLQLEKSGFAQKRVFPISTFVRAQGNLLFYGGYDNRGRLGVGVALISKDNPAQVLWKSDKPLWRSRGQKKYQSLAVIRQGGRYVFYYKDNQEQGRSVKLPLIPLRNILFGFESLKELTKKERVFYLKLRKNKWNPILVPCEENCWEANGAFNSAALHLDNKVHLVYRAVGRDGASALGYAASKDGFRITERANQPIYFPREPFEFVGPPKKRKKLTRYPYLSGGSWGGWGGCEDPRICEMEGRVFMTYTAFNGWQAPGVALTSIKTEDFLSKRWKWKKSRLISPPGEIQKNWVLFPEKINGKYAILHGLSPNILIDYFDSLEGDWAIKSHYSKSSKGLKWENFLRGVGSPPIKTEHGWLVFYHAMDHQHPDRYKLGVMLLDYRNPQKILSRYHEPILEPSEFYENDGKPGVVYVCGAVLKGKKVFVYYGGADRVTCVATIFLEDLLDGLLNQPEFRGKKRAFRMGGRL
jgi:predicted GH43/DUF377 family glycosyl hydrolase